MNKKIKFYGISEEVYEFCRQDVLDALSKQYKVKVWSSDGCGVIKEFPNSYDGEESRDDVMVRITVRYEKDIKTAPDATE